MKPIIQFWILIVLHWGSITASAYDFEVDGIYYNILSLDDSTCEVTYNPENKVEKPRVCYPSYSGSITIHASVIYKGRELTVTKIGEYAFVGCDKLTSLTLPTTITKITFSDYCGSFEYCRSLETLSVGNPYTLYVPLFSLSYKSNK